MRIGSYLRRARERRGLTIDEVAACTKIKPELIDDLEWHDLGRWPKARLYRHGYLRAWAEALGLDAQDLLARFDAEFGDPHPAAFHRARPPAGAPVAFGHAASAILTISLLILAGAELSRVDPQPPAPAPLEARHIASFDPWIPKLPPLRDEIVTAHVEGELRIVSNPPRARVTVNGIGRGSTPLRVRYLPLGEHRVRVIHPGYGSSETQVSLSLHQPNRTVNIALR